MRFLFIIFYILFTLLNANTLKAAFIKSEIEEKDGGKRIITISLREKESVPMWNKSINDKFNFEDDERKAEYRSIQFNEIVNTVGNITALCFKSEKINFLEFLFIDFLHEFHPQYLINCIEKIENIERFDHSNKFLKIDINADDLVALNGRIKARNINAKEVDIEPFLEKLRLFKEKQEKKNEDEKKERAYEYSSNQLWIGSKDDLISYGEYQLDKNN